MEVLLIVQYLYLKHFFSDMHAGFLVQMNVQLASESLFLMEKYHCTVQKCIFSLIWNMGGAHEKWIQKCYVPREYSASVRPRLSKKSCLTCLRILSFQIVYIWSHVCFPTFRQQITPRQPSIWRKEMGFQGQPNAHFLTQFQISGCLTGTAMEQMKTLVQKAWDPWL